MIDHLHQHALWASRRVSKTAIPLVLGIALAFGGASREGLLAVGFLQVAGLAAIAWCLLDPRTPPLAAQTRPALLLAVGLVLVAVLQLIPLPWGLWTAIPHRQAVAEAFTLNEQAGRSAPLTLAPERTLNGLFYFAPPLAAYIIAVSRAWRALTAYLLWVIPSLAALSVALGFAQIFDKQNASLYFYQVTSEGQPVGFFANINHQATYLLMACPFTAALASKIRRGWGMGDTDYGLALVAGTLFLLIILGVLMAGSLAGYVLLGPTLVLCFLVYGGGSRRAIDVAAMTAGGAALTALIALTATSPLLSRLGVTDWSSNDLARGEIFQRTFQALGDHFPFGIGLGAFEPLYPIYENPASVTYKFVNHAHNDYLEFVLEMGVFGVLGLGALLTWVGHETFKAWRGKDRSEARLKRAASIALGVVALHSLVDYPLRTPAIAVAAAVCLAVLVAPTHDNTARRRGTDTTLQSPRSVTL